MAWTVTLKESVIKDLRWFGKIVLVGEKRGNALLVRGEEFTSHHESDSPD